MTWTLTTLADIAEYVCKPGYRFIDRQRTTSSVCIGGSWSAAVPDCIRTYKLRATFHSLFLYYQSNQLRYCIYLFDGDSFVYTVMVESRRSLQRIEPKIGMIINRKKTKTKETALGERGPPLRRMRLKNRDPNDLLNLMWNSLSKDTALVRFTCRILSVAFT